MRTVHTRKDINSATSVMDLFSTLPVFMGFFMQVSSLRKEMQLNSWIQQVEKVLGVRWKLNEVLSLKFKASSPDNVLQHSVVCWPQTWADINFWVNFKFDRLKFSLFSPILQRKSENIQLNAGNMEILWNLNSFYVCMLFFPAKIATGIPDLRNDMDSVYRNRTRRSFFGWVLLCWRCILVWIHLYERVFECLPFQIKCGKFERMTVLWRHKWCVNFFKC